MTSPQRIAAGWNTWHIFGAANVTVVGNVGDDVDVLGLAVSPDLDSILYALAGLHDEERGWGRAGETWEALATVSALDHAPAVLLCGANTTAVDFG